MSRLANLWEDSAVAAPPTPPLAGRAEADVLVIGAGYLGLSAALHLAERGRSVVVLDAHGPGWGASGRNGGQVIPGLKHDPDELEAELGPEAGRRLWEFAGRTADVVFDLVDRHGLRAEARRTAWIQGIAGPKAAARARSRAEQWRRRGADVAYLGRDEAAALIGADRYEGAFVDRRAGALQPLSYARELARAALRAGAAVHGGSRVVSLRPEGGGWRAATEAGATALARTVLLCANAYADRLRPELPASVVAANSLQIATAPLPTGLRATILPGGEVLSDTRRVIRYWRLDGAGRLIMGGRGPYREPGPARDWAHLTREVHRLYPALRDVPFTHRWGGRVAVHPDYRPRLHRPEPGLLAAIGCQGRGVGWQTAMGAEMARLVTEPDAVSVLPVTGVRAIPFAPLKRVGVSLTITAMRALDRLGLG